MMFETGEKFYDCLDGLSAFLYSHELYHYRFDAHCLQMEATGGISIYKPYSRLLSGLPMEFWHEESVANFYALKSLQPTRTYLYSSLINDYLLDLVANSPGAYAGGIDAQQGDRKDKMAEQATVTIKSAGPPSWESLVGSIIRMGTGFSKPSTPGLSSFLSLNNCPVQWIDWVKGGRSILAPQAVPVSEIKGDFVKRYLAGVEQREGKHLFYRIDNGELIKLPNPHRADATDSEFRNIIGKAGMTAGQFWGERKRTRVWKVDVPRSPVRPSRFRSKGGVG
jgi:hypothetical protein